MRFNDTNKVLTKEIINMRNEDLTVKEGIDEYLENVKARLRPATHSNYKQYLGYISKYLGEKKIIEITRRDIDYLVNSKRAESPNISNVSLNKFITNLKIYFKFHTGTKLKYNQLKEEKKETVLVEDQVKSKIFKHYEQNIDNKYCFRNYLYFRLLLDTGLRMNELCNIRLENIDLTYNVLLATVTKSGVARYVPFTDATAEILKKYILIYIKRDYIFFDFKTGNMLTPSAVESFISRLKKKLEIKGSITPHKWRHTFATSFARAGGNIEALRTMLGHSNLKTTQKYLHLNRDDILKCYHDIF